jgi:hypothetical protein
MSTSRTPPRGVEAAHAELLRLLQTPSAASWAALERLFPAAAPADQERLVREAESGLEAWPDELRSLTFADSAVPDRASWRVGPSAEEAPWLALARTLEVEPWVVQRIVPASAVVRWAFPKIRRLDITGPIQVPDSRAVDAIVAVARMLPALESLHLDHATLVSRKADAPPGFAVFWKRLFAHLGPARIRRLELSWLQLGLPGLKALLASPLAPRLEHLGITACLLDPQSAAALAHWPEPSALRTLDAGADKINGHVLGSWSQTGFLGLLEALRCEGNPLRPEDLQPLVSESRVLRLRALDLSGTVINNDFAVRLAASPALPHMEDLRIRACILDDDISEMLSMEPFRSRIRILDLSSNQLTDDFARALVRRPPPPNLTRLHLGENEITEEGLGLLRAWSGRLAESLLAVSPSLMEDFWARPRGTTH